MNNPLYIVCNFSGNVGKTMLTKNGLSARLSITDFERVIAVETINSGAEDVNKVAAEQTKHILQRAMALQATGPVIIDVGSSNVAEFFRQTGKLSAVLPLVTKFIVPCIASDKVVKDTVATVGALVEMGVPVTRIAVILNRINRLTDRTLMRPLTKLLGIGVLVAKTEISEDDIYDVVRELRSTVTATAALRRDYQADLQSGALTEDEADEAAKFFIYKASAAGAQKELESLMDELEVPAL